MFIWPCLSIFAGGDRLYILWFLSCLIDCNTANFSWLLPAQIATTETCQIHDKLPNSQPPHSYNHLDSLDRRKPNYMNLNLYQVEGEMAYGLLPFLLCDWYVEISRRPRAYNAWKRQDKRNRHLYGIHNRLSYSFLTGIVCRLADFKNDKSTLLYCIQLINLWFELTRIWSPYMSYVIEMLRCPSW